jgi:hypothetical protein
MRDLLWTTWYHAQYMFPIDLKVLEILSLFIFYCVLRVFVYVCVCDLIIQEPVN